MIMLVMMVIMMMVMMMIMTMMTVHLLMMMNNDNYVDSDGIGSRGAKQTAAGQATSRSGRTNGMRV